MLYHTSLDNYYETNFSLMQHHSWNLNEIEGMIPFEREIYVTYLKNYIEKKNLEAAQKQNANSW
tara:strand:- start:4627 stop:4818 length:192 start_codon:yes stop_codon:yes gene_type:complete